MYGNVVHQHVVVTDDHVFVDETEWSDFAILTDLRIFVDIG